MTSEKYCPPEQDTGRLEISMFMTVSTRPVQTQVKLNSYLERGGGHEAPPLPEEMGAIDNAGRGGVSFL